MAKTLLSMQALRWRALEETTPTLLLVGRESNPVRFHEVIDDNFDVTRFIRQHYGKYLDQHADMHARAGMLRLDTPAANNVVPMVR